MKVSAYSVLLWGGILGLLLPSEGGLTANQSSVVGSDHDETSLS